MKYSTLSINQKINLKSWSSLSAAKQAADNGNIFGKTAVALSMQHANYIKFKPAI